jgi:hypothetical protein
LPPGVYETRRNEIRMVLGAGLPYSFRGFSTNFTEPDPNDRGTQRLNQIDRGAANHRVEMFTLKGFFAQYMNIDIEKHLQPADWLTIPFQKLRSICAGRVFHDDLGLSTIRDNFKWYPDDIWLYLLASGWSRIGEEEHITGRAGIVGDDIGSYIIASRLVRDIMRLAFLMEKTYPPYAKWFGTAFGKLKCAKMLQPVLKDVLGFSTWMQRDARLAKAYKYLADMHNALGITPVLSSKPSRFWGRPFTVIHGERFADALLKSIHDETVKAIAGKRPIGNIDMISDNTDLLEDPIRRKALLGLYL